MRRLLGFLVALIPVSAVAGTAVLSPGEAREQAAQGQVVLIDVRTPDEWRATGVPESAILANVNAPDFLERTLAVTEGDKGKPIALICRSGNRSTKAAELLAAQGFTRIYNVREGIEGGGAGPGWLKRGLPVKPCQC